MAFAQGEHAMVSYNIRDTDLDSFAQNVFHFQLTELADGSDAAVATDFLNFGQSLYGTINGAWHNTTEVYGYRVDNISKRLRVFQGLAAVSTGQLADASTLPAQIAAEVLARGAGLGETARKYLPFFSESAVEDGRWGAVTLGDLANFLNIYEAPYFDAGSGNGWTPEAVRIDNKLVTSWWLFQNDKGQVIDTCRTMRTRIPGRGI